MFPQVHVALLIGAVSAISVQSAAEPQLSVLDGDNDLKNLAARYQPPVSAYLCGSAGEFTLQVICGDMSAKRDC
jgi:hypothetical protein